MFVRVSGCEHGARLGGSGGFAGRNVAKTTSHLREPRSNLASFRIHDLAVQCLHLPA